MRAAARQQSAYAGLRLGATILCALSVLVLVIVTVSIVVDSRITADGVVLTLLVMLVELIGILFVYGLAQALLDIADSAVRHHHEKR